MQVYEALAALFGGMYWVWDALAWAVRPYLLVALLIGLAYFARNLYAITWWTHTRMRDGTEVPPALRFFLPSDKGVVPMVFQRPVVLLYAGVAIVVQAVVTAFLAVFWFIPVTYLTVAFVGDRLTGRQR